MSGLNDSPVVYDQQQKLFVYFNAQFIQAYERYADNELVKSNGIIMSARKTSLAPLELRVMCKGENEYSDKIFYVEHPAIVKHLLTDLSINDVDPTDMATMNRRITNIAVSTYISQSANTFDLVGISKKKF